MIKPIHLVLALLVGGLIAYFMIPRPGNDTVIQNKIDSLHAVVRWKEIRESHYRDSIKAKDESLQINHRKTEEAARLVSLAEARALEWRQRYYTLKKLMPQNAKDSLRDLVLTGNACDSLVTELGELSEKRKEQVTAINNELQASYSKIKTLDTLNLIILSENRDLKQLDSLHVKNEKILKKKARKSFFKGTAIGVVIGLVVAIIL